MEQTRSRLHRFTATASAATLLAAALVPAMAQQEDPEVVAVVGGDPVYRLLPVGGIPAIDEPRFVSGEQADAQMSPSEPVLAIEIDGKARAYSLWQLDAHEIVNDEVGGKKFAVTW